MCYKYLLVDYSADVSFAMFRTNSLMLAGFSDWSWKTIAAGDNLCRMRRVNHRLLSNHHSAPRLPVK